MSERRGDFYGQFFEKDWLRFIDSMPDTKQARVVAIASKTFDTATSMPCLLLSVQDTVTIADAFAHGALKYGKVGDWRTVPLDHHIQAAGRHFDAWLKDPTSLDAESGLTHEAHFLARAVMIQELRRTK